MAGLYDSIDPQTALLLGLGSGLLGTVGQGRRASFGEALANGMQAGTAGYRQAVGDRQRAEQMRAEQQMREQQMRMQMEEATRAQGRYGMEQRQFDMKMGDAERSRADQQRLRDALAQNTINVGPTLEGPPESRLDRQGYANALEMIDPDAGAEYRQKITPRPLAPMKVGRDDRVIDPVTNRVLVDAMPKEVAPTDSAKKLAELRALGYPEEVAQGIAFNMLQVVPDGAGGTAIVHTARALEGMTGGAPRMQGGAPPMIGARPPMMGSGAAPPAMRSPYSAPPPMPGQIGSTPGTKPMERLNADVKGFAETLEKSNIPQLESTLVNIERIISKYKTKGEDGKESTKDLPGFGATGMLPNFMLFADGRELRQAVAPLANLTLKDRSGAAVTNPEHERFKTELGTGVLMSDDELLRGLANARALIDSTKANHMAGAHPEVIAEYNKRYGANTQVPLGAGPAPGAQQQGAAPAAQPAAQPQRLKTISSAQIDTIVRDAFAMGKTRAEVLRRLQDEGFSIPMK